MPRSLNVMVAQDLNSEWLTRYTRALEAHGYSFDVRPYNDLRVWLGAGVQAVIRNIASVVPQRIHLVAYTSVSDVADSQLQAASLSQKLEDGVTRVRGRAIQDAHGKVYVELICMAGEPGDVPSHDQLHQTLPQLFTLIEQTHQQLQGS